MLLICEREAMCISILFKYSNVVICIKQRGSFSANKGRYNIEPFNPRVHKRSLNAKHGDHIVQRADEGDFMLKTRHTSMNSLKLSQCINIRVYLLSTNILLNVSKYSLYKLVVYSIDPALETFSGDGDYHIGRHGDKTVNQNTGRSKRQTSQENTTYTIELHMTVDVYYYNM